MSSNLPSIRLERILNAPVERVFRAFVDPADAVRWWGPAGVRTSEVEIDLRVGGTCRWVMHPKGATAVLRGRILELDPPRLLVMTNQWDGDAAVTLVTLRFHELGDQTRLELLHEQLPKNVDPMEFERGWGAALESLGQYIAESSGVEQTK
jgi:uncharacterized protein YndB with AHSA1/START domain